MQRFYLTTPIYYINAEPHLGHAYTTMVADAIARSRRLLGDDVFFLTGTDEHGQKVERAAQKAGLDPHVFADKIAGKYRELFKALNISNDDFIRTTEPRHIHAAQAIWRRVRDRGYLYKAPYEGWYCTVDELFVPEAQLVDGRCPTCGTAVERLSEQSYFFKLSAFQEPLLDLYRTNPGFLTPEIRRNEMISFVSAGLRDLSVSRTSFKWGIPVPDDPGHVMYVWFDALTNYLTAVGFPDDETRFQRYWPADVHLMGKEIVRQHTVYWPAFLMAAGLELPRRVVGHGWWLMNDAKMSKSLGNVVHPKGYTDRFGVDALRYFVMREMVVGQDASFTDDVFLTRYNSDLANDLGNVVSRTTTMIQRYCEGIVPAPAAPEPADVALGQRVDAVIASATAQTLAFDFSGALRDVWSLISDLNKYIVTREPWTLAKNPDLRPKLDATLGNSADILRVVAALIEPVMPSTSARIRVMLGIGAESWVGLKSGSIPAGTRLGTIEPLFPRMEHTVEELRQMADNQPINPAPASEAAPATAPTEVAAAPAVPPSQWPMDQRISIDDFMKIDLRVARITAAERVPNSKKLMKLQIDLGSEQRTLVAGISEAYEADALVGRHVAIVANLKPAKLMGIESNGMVLAASPDGGKPLLVSFEAPPSPGTRVR
ncbi:MAG TPA: methionine--tRNA ligase [Vicinamibacterales bacterium]|nr:methionine--tRNA ligase [Vicinamibacterales bacterium]